MNQVERDLLGASREIGGIVDMAHWASAGMAALVESTGKQVDEMTVGELRALIRQQAELHGEIFDRTQGKD